MRHVGIVDEATLNAVRAALDERVARLERDLVERRLYAPFVESEDYQRAIVWTNAAIMETKAAQDVFAEVEPMMDHPADATWTSA